MDWDDVRVFLAVARAGQFVAAARALKVDHATAARRVSALERALNARLVERRTTGVLLTEAGARFLAAAERMETACLQAQAELGDRDVELSGTVRVGAPDGLSTYYLAGLFAALAERYPAIAIQLVGYVEEFNYSPALGYVAELCGDAPVAFQCAGAIGQLEAVRAGIGVGVLHDFIARRHPDLVRVLPGRRTERSYWIVEHEDTRGIGRIRAVHDALVQAATRDRATFIAR